jgi:hypothetical protein
MPIRNDRATLPSRSILGMLVLALSTMSILAGLRHVLGGRSREPAREEAIRAGDWPEQLRPVDVVRDRSEIRRSLPVLDPPAYHAVRDDRDARG